MHFSFPICRPPLVLSAISVPLLPFTLTIRHTLLSLSHLELPLFHSYSPPLQSLTLHSLTPPHPTLRHTTPPHTPSHYTTPHSVTLHHPTLPHTTAPHTSSHYTTLHSLPLHHLHQVFSMGSWERCSRALGSFHHVPHIALAGTYNTYLCAHEVRAGHILFITSIEYLLFQFTLLRTTLFYVHQVFFICFYSVHYFSNF